MEWLDSLSYSFVVPMVVVLGFAPFFPRPHIYEKIAMLKNGELKRPIDIFDLLYHTAPFVILFTKLFRDIFSK